MAATKLPIKAGYLLAAGGGAILLYSGIKGHRWGSTLRSLISGQKIPSTQELAIQTSGAAYAYGSGSKVGTAPNLGVGGSATKNKAIARVLCAPYGWSTGAQWTALDRLWTQESGWNNHAKNPSSGAYGIPQSLPASKMGSLANPPTSSASAQIAWGLRYIKQTYGDPIHAEQHEISQGWY